MQWWTDFLEWFVSEDGWRIVSGAIIPFVAIVVAGLVAGLIGRGSTRRVMALADRERRTSTVSALIGAARRASKWNSLSDPEQHHAEHLANEADVSLRLLPVGGAVMTADWAAHEITEMKKNSVSFSFQAEQSLTDFRDRLVDWQIKPSRARKLFKPDLDLWAYESAQDDQGLVQKQQAWAKQQVATESESVDSGMVPDNSWGARAIKQVTASEPVATQVDSRPLPVAPAYAAAHTNPHAQIIVAELETDTSEAPELVTPDPVPAHTVRQRTADPDPDDAR